jgi:hypothetical protein
MFTGYEILKLKAGYDIKDLILKGILRPYFRATFTSLDSNHSMPLYPRDTEKTNIKNWDSQLEPELDFDSAENQEEPEQQSQIAQPTAQPQIIKKQQPVQLELDFDDENELNESQIRVDRSFDKRVFDTSNNNMLDIKGVVFKIDMKRLSEMFEIERN